MLSIYIITVVYACPLTHTLANTAHCRTFKFLLIQELILIYIPWDLVESITCSNTFFPLAVGSDFFLSICRSSLYIPGINPLYFMSWKCFILFCLSGSEALTDSSGSAVTEWRPGVLWTKHPHELACFRWPGPFQNHPVSSYRSLNPTLNFKKSLDSNNRIWWRLYGVTTLTKENLGVQISAKGNPAVLVWCES